MKKFVHMILVSVLLCSLPVITGCASMKGTHEEVAFNSDPQGALLKVDGEYRGITPKVLELKRGYKNHTYELDLPGYETFKSETQKTVNWITFLNILNYGVGFVPDLINGSVCEINLVPTVVMVKIQTPAPVVMTKQPALQQKKPAKATQPKVVKSQPKSVTKVQLPAVQQVSQTVVPTQMPKIELMGGGPVKLPAIPQINDSMPCGGHSSPTPLLQSGVIVINPPQQ